MPGFHEHEEDDTDPSQSQSQNIDSHDVEEPDYLSPISKADSDASTTAHEEVQPSKPKSRPRPPISAPATSSQDNVASTSSLSPVARSKMRTKPRSTSASTNQHANSPSLSIHGVPKHSTTKPEPKNETTSQTHSCPICGKELQTDNQGLNEHIDFCLSRGAIREAQAQASTSPGTRRKPDSAGVASASWAAIMKNKPPGGKPQRKGR